MSKKSFKFANKNIAFEYTYNISSYSIFENANKNLRATIYNVPNFLGFYTEVI